MSLPESIIEEAVRLTRLARRARDAPAARDYRARRESLLAAYDYRARVRSEESHASSAGILVCYPAEWMTDGTVDPARIDDLSRAVERPIEAGVGDEDWETVEAHNRSIAEQVAAAHGPAHGANAHAFADFMSNHYASRVDHATSAHVEEFLTEYYPRNAWPTAAQRAVVTESVALVVEE